MFGNHGLCGLLEEGAHGKSPKCLGGHLGDFGEFCKGLRRRNGRKSCCTVSNIVFAELIYGTRSSEKRNWISDDLVDVFCPAVYHEYRLYIVKPGASPVNLPCLIRTIYYRR